MPAGPGDRNGAGRRTEGNSTREESCVHPVLLSSGAAGGAGGPAPGVSYGAGGLVAPGGSFRYVTVPAGRNTVIQTVRIRGGRVGRFNLVPGSYGIPLVAYDGSTAGLAARGRTLVLAQPQPQRPSRFLVLDAKTLRVRQEVTLRGMFAFDAISPGGRMLYLIQFVSARNASRYVVRAYDLQAGRLLRQPVVDRRENETVMSGMPVSRASSRDARWAYTLYTRPGAPPFVHALDTMGRKAVCIDLPWRGSQDPLWRMRLGLRSRGTELVLRKRGTSGGTVAVIDTRTFRVTRV